MIVPTYDQFIKDNNVDGATTLLANLIIQLVKDAKVFVTSEQQLVGLIKQLRDRSLYPLTELYQTVQCVKDAKQAGTPVAACVRKAGPKPITRSNEPLKPKAPVVDTFAVDAEKQISEGNFAGALKSVSAARIGNRKMLLLQILDHWDAAKSRLTSKDVIEAASNLATLDKVQVERTMAAIENDQNAATALSLIGKGEYGQAFILLGSIKTEYRLPVFLHIADMWGNTTKPANGAKLPAPVTIEGTPYSKVDYYSMYARAGQLLTGADRDWVNKTLESIKKSE